MDRNPLFAIAHNSTSQSSHVIDTLRFFTDLIDVLHLEADEYTSASEILAMISDFNMNAKDGVEEDVFLWLLRDLGPDLWENFDQRCFNYSLSMCLNYEAKERIEGLLKLCPDALDAPDTPDGYSLLHRLITDSTFDPTTLLAIGADATLVGFNAYTSTFHETPISLALYRADTLANCKEALKTTGADLENVIGRALENPHDSAIYWSKETLTELLATDLDISPLFIDGSEIACQYCLYPRDLLVQPVWLAILQEIDKKPKRQTVEDRLKPLLSRILTGVYEGDHEHRQVYLKERKEEEEEEEEEERENDEEGELYCIDCTMCVLCWQKWQETGLNPIRDREKCLCCGIAFVSHSQLGDDAYDVRLCGMCNHRQNCEVQLRKRRGALTQIDSDEDEDEFSPYLIHA